MQVKELINKHKLKNKHKTIVNNIYNKQLLNKYINNNCYKKTNSLLEKYNALIEPKFRAWFAKAFFQLSENQIASCAEQAKSGNSPKRYFSWLISNSLKNTENMV